MLINLSHLGLLKVTGPDAKKLLQGQLTCNLDEITASCSRLGAHCNPQGRILCAFRLFWYQESYYLQMPQEVLAEALKALNKYAVFFKVKIHDATDTLTRLAATEAELAPYFSDLPSNADAVLTAENLLIARLPGSPPIYEIMGDPAIIASLGFKATTDNAHNSWKLSNITAGIPTIYAATVGKLLPHEINYPAINGVSFNKGCYTGQEIITRMHYRGQIKKHMHRARVNTNTLPLAGADIYLEGPSGTIIDSCQDETGYCQLLVLANISDVQSRKLYLDPDKLEPLEFMPLPY